jgi:dTDP-4-dehydrorhamnose 3,5-epimerase
MDIEALGIDGAWLATSPVHRDNRGTFREWFKLEEIASATGLVFGAQQANISTSSAGVLRGIHFSTELQAKWVTCITGEIHDYIIDLRPESATFKKWISVELTPDSGRAVLIAPGLGHAFVAIKDNSTISYLLSTPYAPESEFAISPFDTELAIDWAMDESELILSERDERAPSLKEYLARS